METKSASVQCVGVLPYGCGNPATMAIKYDDILRIYSLSSLTNRNLFSSIRGSVGEETERCCDKHYTN